MLVQVVLVDALSRLVIDSSRAADYAAEVAGAKLAARYGVTPPLRLDGEETAEGFRWVATRRRDLVLPGMQHCGGDRFTELPPKRPQLPEWARLVPMTIRREATRRGDGDTLAGLVLMLEERMRCNCDTTICRSLPKREKPPRRPA